MQQFVGANVRLARLFHGLTMEDVAVRIGKTRQYVHKVETEQIEPPMADVEAIASLTQVQPAFFFSAPVSPVTEEQCHFRKRMSARVGVKQVALAKGEVFRRLVGSLDRQLDLPANTIPQIDVSSLVEIEQAAEHCRRVWGVGLGPINNMTRLAEHVGAVATSFKGVSREIDAYSISAARPIIVLNSEESSACRLRFDVAHELGHLVMHVGTITGDRKTEGEANRFAGAFLLPRSSFVKEFPKLRGRHLNWQGLVDMKMRWKVSKSALLYRAKQLGLISDDQYTTGVIRLSRGGEARGENEDHLIPKEIPELFSQAIRLAYTHYRMSFDTYCESLNLTASLVEEFVVPPGATSPDSPVVLEDDAKIVSLESRRRATVTALMRKRS
ncbi:helix-turn-helix domain-containing protein [Xanthomonas hortorum]|uniref:helix-turn-helix domain-containing protein n=1 Tax=Xanthomonas hortorum TaxID=56454 RepID=UPI001594B134|nr:XRE family transcriptional regulator [Xanthomonas hortorum]NHF64713.1 ImmA/IrrE family metallo-endopeptidase [Xanthomonas hortorum]